MLGYQATLDVYDYNKDYVIDQRFITNLIDELAELLETNVISIHSHEFDTHGLSVIGIISASHIAIHTWPEHQFAAIDIFSCKSLFQVNNIIFALKRRFGTDEIACVEFSRGERLSSPYFQNERVAKEKIIMDWYFEDLRNGEKRGFDVLERIIHQKTKFQLVEIIRSSRYGKILFLNGERQSSEIDEFIYHEMLVHPALFCHPNPKKVFIAGGGEGATAREVLKHHSVDEVIQVDIDEELVGLCEEHLPSWSDSAYKNKRMNLCFGDALDFLRNQTKVFDVIIVDFPEWSPESGLDELYSDNFYQLLKDRLSLNGVVALQVGPFHPAHIDNFVHVANKLLRNFNQVTFYSVTELRWGFAFCSNTKLKIDNFDVNRIKGTLRYLNGEIFNGLNGGLPEYVNRKLADI